MDTFIIDTNNLPFEEQVDTTDYDSYLMIYTKDRQAGYKYGHKEGCEKQLSIILNQIRHSDMFIDLVELIPEDLENGLEIVCDADTIYDETKKELDIPLIQPLNFHNTEGE